MQIFYFLTITLLVSFIVLVIYYLRNKFFDKNNQLQFLTIVIAIISASLSVFAVFRDELVGANLQIYFRNYATTRFSAGDGTFSAIALPISFINNGYRGVVVEDVLLTIRQKGQNKYRKYIPVMVSKLSEVMAGKLTFNPDSFDKRLLPFLVKEHEAEHKNIVFSLRPSAGPPPTSEWIPAEYFINVYVKTNSNPTYQILKSFTFTCGEDTIKAWKTDMQKWYTLDEYTLQLDAL